MKITTPHHVNLATGERFDEVVGDGERRIVPHETRRTPSRSLGLIRELRGTVCRCGRTKNTMQTFCRACYFLLTPAQRKALYRHVGEGYEEAYADAERVLKGQGRIREAV